MVPEACTSIGSGNFWLSDSGQDKPMAHPTLDPIFFLRRVEKSYVALVYTNSIPLPAAGTIKVPIDGLPAVSSFIVLERYPDDLITKIGVTTKQGRKHQVRIHCSKGLGAPILLDPLYGGESIMYQLPNDDACAKKCRAQQRFCLHADSLTMIPDLSIPKVEAAIPEWWDGLIKDIHYQLQGNWNPLFCGGAGFIHQLWKPLWHTSLEWNIGRTRIQWNGSKRNANAKWCQQHTCQERYIGVPPSYQFQSIRPTNQPNWHPLQHHFETKTTTIDDLWHSIEGNRDKDSTRCKWLLPEKSLSTSILDQDRPVGPKWHAW